MLAPTSLRAATPDIDCVRLASSDVKASECLCKIHGLESHVMNFYLKLKKKSAYSSAYHMKKYSSEYHMYLLISPHIS